MQILKVCLGPTALLNDSPELLGEEEGLLHPRVVAGWYKERSGPPEGKHKRVR